MTHKNLDFDCQTNNIIQVLLCEQMLAIFRQLSNDQDAYILAQNPFRLIFRWKRIIFIFILKFLEGQKFTLI